MPERPRILVTHTLSPAFRLRTRFAPPEAAAQIGFETGDESRIAQRPARPAVPSQPLERKW